MPCTCSQNIKRAAARRQQWLAAGHGEYREAATEKDFFAEVKAEERVVCHFYRDSLPCKVRRHDWCQCASIEHPTACAARWGTNVARTCTHSWDDRCPLANLTAADETVAGLGGHRSNLMSISQQVDPGRWSLH